VLSKKGEGGELFGNKRPWFIILFIVFAGFFAAFLVRDLYLTVESDDGDKNVFAVENIHYQNIIDDSLYILDAKKGWKTKDMYILEDISISIKGSSDNEWKVQAKKGSVPELSGGVVSLKDAKGITQVSSDKYHWESPEIHWKPDEKLFFFDNGIRAFGDLIEIESQRGVVRLSGEMQLSERVKVVYKAQDLANK
jgi:hypothetical protein